MTKTIAISLILILSSGRASRQQIIVDGLDISSPRYQEDLYQCREIAKQVDSKAGGGALAGALVGGALGSAFGNKRKAEKWAAVGAVSGLAKGARLTKKERQTVVKNCLRERGYKVLN